MRPERAEHVDTPTATLTRRVGWLPQGGMLPVPLWERRHRALWFVLAFHVPLIVAFALVRGYSLTHGLIEVTPVASLAVLGRISHYSRPLRSCAVSAGLITASGVLVHLAGGVIEMHFHFFVVVALLTLYQDWLPYLTAIALTVFEHGIAGAINGHAVYNHPDAVAHPWRWALIHGGFVLAASAANVACWRVNETERQRLNADRDAFYAEQVRALSDQALRDPLTGLANRQLLLDRLTHALALAKRNGTRLAVVFIDLDGFKQVNDNYGHRTGDDLLRQTAQLLSGRVRGQDTLARLGGDEFVLLCENIDGEQTVDSLIDNLRALVATPMRVAGTNYQVAVTGAFGVEYSDESSDAAELLDLADQRMYAEKHSRRTTLPGQRREPSAGRTPAH